MGGGIEIRVTRGDPTFVLIAGDLDFRTARDAAGALAGLVGRGHVRLVVDLSGCGYVDSSGMLALVESARGAQAAGGSVTLANPPRTLTKLLSLSHVGSLLGVEDSEAPAPSLPTMVDTAVGRWDVCHMVAPAEPRCSSWVRRYVVQAAAETPLTPEGRTDLETAVGEAFANAVRHGAPRGSEDRVRVRCLRGTTAFVVEITDDGEGFDPDSVPVPNPGELVPGGLGLHCMRMLTDRVDFESGPRGTTVRLVKLYPAAAAPL